MSVPKKQQARWHGGCSEVVCLDKAFTAGVNPAGGTIKTVNIGNISKSQKHKAPKPPCPSCEGLESTFDVKMK